MAPRAKYYEWDGQHLTARDLAELRGCTSINMRQLIKRHGMPDAMTVPTRGIAQPPVKKPRGKPIHGLDAGSRQRIGEYNTKLERYRRIKQWYSMGMTIEEIRIKEKQI